MMRGRNTKSRILIERIPYKSVGVELGVWRGGTAHRFMASHRPREMHLVDAWSIEPYRGPQWEDYMARYSGGRMPPTEEAFQRHYDKVYEDVRQRMRGRNVIVHRCTTAEFFEKFDQKVDWVYVDAGHDYDSVLADLEGSLGIVKPGGFIWGDDYGSKRHTGVKAAVDDFVARHPELTFEVLGQEQYEICIPAA